jgi:hypothetical protein
MNLRGFLALLLCFYSGFSYLFAQTKDSTEPKKSYGVPLPEWIHDMVYDTSSSTRPRFLIYPVIGFAPETGWEFGLSSLVVFHYNNDTTLRLSEISAFGFYTQKQQLGLWVDHAIYGRNNDFLTLGRMRFQNYPLYYYGIGSNIGKNPTAIANANYYSIRERFVYRLKGNLFVGLELDYQQISNSDFRWKESTPITERNFPLGASGSKNLGLGFGVLLDSRHNMLNVREGYLAELAFIHYGDLFKESFNMNTLFLDGRYFIPTSKNQVLAFQVVGQFSAGNVPFNQLSLMGGETMMRGYYLGRYRDKNYVAAQAEYRFLPFDFSRRVGGTIFGAVGAVSDAFPTNRYKWSAGAGLRYLLFPKKDIFTRVDLGLNPDGYGVYFYIGEAF